ncbi:hypothetical protein ACMFMG_009147 [Clarireedia jacksonii]
MLTLPHRSREKNNEVDIDMTSLFTICLDGVLQFTRKKSRKIELAEREYAIYTGNFRDRGSTVWHIAFSSVQDNLRRHTTRDDTVFKNSFMMASLQDRPREFSNTIA